MADNPYYRFFRRHDVPMAWRTWERLPRFPSYKKEYWDGQAHYSPRIETVDLYLDLHQWEPPTYPPDDPPGLTGNHVRLRPLKEQDWDLLPDTFNSAFADQPPLSGWGRAAAARASRAIVSWTRLGRDGPLVHPACFGAWSTRQRYPEPGSTFDSLCGAAVVVTVDARGARGAPGDAGVPHPERPDEQVMPHLNWVFVSRWGRREGVGSALLGQVAGALRSRGFRWLCSTCLMGNSASLLWHWRNGFILGASGWSFRAARIEPEG